MANNFSQEFKVTGLAKVKKKVFLRFFPNSLDLKSLKITHHSKFLISYRLVTCYEKDPSHNRLQSLTFCHANNLHDFL